MIRVIAYSIRNGGKRYLKGDCLDGLSKKEEARLVSLGYAKSVEALEVEIPDTDPYNLKNMNVEEAKSFIEDIRDTNKLYSILESEALGKKRTTLIEFIEALIEEVAGEGNDL